jgi:carboxyl-terminal processing protease
MKKHILKIAIALIIAFSLQGCEENLLQEKFENNPVGIYEQFWGEFDQFYGAFEAKGLNWDSLKWVYGNQLTESSSDKELFSSMSGLLHELNDGHADLYSKDQGFFRSWNRRNKPYFIGLRSRDMNNVASLQGRIRSKYLNNQFQSGDYSGWKFFWGTIAHENQKIGYICIPTFHIPDYPNDFIQQAIDSFNHLDAVIIDLRFNGGGRTEAFVSSLNAFANEKKCYMQSQFRNGKERNNFTVKAEHWTNPHSNGLEKIPVALLMNSFSASSSDHFILGMKTQSNVFTVGDTTCGAFSAVLEKTLPNGWKYRLGAQVVYKPNGEALTDSNGEYLEGIGIAPDFYAPDTWSEVLKNNDLPLDKALEELSKR